MSWKFSFLFALLLQLLFLLLFFVSSFSIVPIFIPMALHYAYVVTHFPTTKKKSSGIPTFLFRPTFASNAKSFASFQCNSYGNSILLKQRIHTSHIANSFNVLVSYDMRGKGCGKRIGLSQIKNEEIKQQPNALNTFIIAEYMWYEKVGLLYRI